MDHIKAINELSVGEIHRVPSDVDGEISTSAAHVRKIRKRENGGKRISMKIEQPSGTLIIERLE